MDSCQNTDQMQDDENWNIQFKTVKHDSEELNRTIRKKPKRADFPKNEMDTMGLNTVIHF